MITRLRYPKGYQFFDANGQLLALGNLYYYVAGTTTPQDTYSDSAGTITNTNPVVLDGSGRLGVDVYLGSAANYKEVLTASSATVAPWPDDNILCATQPDWNATSGPSQILNKPVLAAVAISGSYTDLSDPPAPISVFTGDSGSGGTSGLVPAPAAGTALADAFLKADGTWSMPPGGSGSGSTNLTVTESATTVSIASSSGAGAIIPSATSTAAGVLDSTRAAKIDGLAAVATSGSYNDLNNKPALGSAAPLNVPSSGNASTSQVVLGTDTRLADSRPPQAHASTHASGGSDPISISASQVSGIPTALGSQNIDAVARLGIGTTDTSNALSVDAPSVLFSNSGDIRTTISKGATANTAAVNFQDNFSTRAQVGLLGDDNFTISTSADGSTFQVAVVAAPSGAVTFPNTAGFTGDSGSGGTAGLVPAPSAGAAAAGEFLKADGAWGVPLGTPQVNADWNATSGTAEILNKPILAPSATIDTTNASNITSGTLSTSLVGDLSAIYLTVSTGGANNGVATLDAGGKLSASQIPASLVGAVVYQSTWDASTNTPALASGTGTKGNYYVVSTAGTTSIDGISQWNPGDTIIFNGTVWNKIDGASPEVLSVAGLYGAVSAPALKTALAIAASDVSGLAIVAASGSYTDLRNTPTIPAAPVNSDWNAESGLAQILNKPTLSAVAASGSYTDLSNKPSAFTGASAGSAGSAGFIPAPSSGQQGLFLRGDASWAAVNAWTSTGTGNYGYGSSSLSAISAGADNIAIGNGAGASISSGYQNIFLGKNAGNATQTGAANIGVGYLALAALGNNTGGLSATNNVAIGSRAGSSITSGSENMLVGNNTGTGLTTGTQNSAFGTEALKSTTTGYGNAAFGGSAFKFGLLAAHNSSAFGNAAGCLSISGNLLTISPYQSWVGNSDTFLGALTTPWANAAVTNAATAAGNNILQFASVPSWVSVGQFVDDFYAVGVIPAGTYVTAVSGTTVALSANVTGAGIGNGDFVTFWGYATSLATSAATASGSTLTFSSVPLSIVAGMTVQDTTAPGIVPANTTVSSVTSTTVTLSNAVTGAGVGSGDAIVFSQGQFDYMTVIGASASGYRPNTIFMGRSQDSVVISPTSLTTASLAGLTIGASNYPRAAINLAASAPSGQNPPIAGDLYFSNGHLYFYNGTLTGQADGVATFLSSGGGYNLFAGPSAGNATMGGTSGQGTDNVLISPTSCGQSLTTGSYNTAVGALSGAGFTTANYNTLLGHAAGQTISSGSQNTAFGSYAGTGISTGTGNICFGYNTGPLLTTGSFNMCIGGNAGGALVSGSGCTFIGAGAGPSVTGGGNVLIGYGAGGSTLTSGTYNTFIGTSAAPASNVSNTLILAAGSASLLIADSTTVRPQCPLKLPSYTVSTLPSASTTGAGTQAWVSDATSPILGQTLSGGGSTACMAVSNGTNWIAGEGASLNCNTFTPSGGSTANLFAGPAAGNATMGGTSSQGVANALFSPNTVGQNITTGYANSVFGSGSGAALSSGYQNAIFGQGCGNGINTGYQNTLAGVASGSSLSSGYQNAVFGYNSGTGMTTAIANVIVGAGSGNAIATGYGNVIVGEGSGTGVTGNSNTIVGYSSAGGLTSGAGNTIVGNGLSSLSNPSNTLILGAGGVQLLVADATTVRPQKPLKVPAYTVSGLPSASTAGAGTRAWATDSTLAYSGANIGTAVTGGGSYGAPVISNGTNWIIG